nr:dynamin family protein [Longispora albida]
MTGAAENAEALIGALAELRAVLRNVRFPLPVDGAGEAAESTRALREQVDDYLLPRLKRLDAPLLVVVGGSTGAGKSTLINSLVRAPVSAAGVLRPTTRAPVLVSHPADSRWFRGINILPGMSRATGMDTAMFRAIRDEDERPNPAAQIHLVTATGLTPGLAFIDAPDIDSLVDSNRQLAGQLFAAADLWLFVTTAARYADAIPWGFLREAVERNVALAIVLDRVPAEAMEEVSAHLREMLAEKGLGEEQFFALPESRLDNHGLLSEDVVRPVKEWFTQLALDARGRAAVVRRTLDGTLRAVPGKVEALAVAAGGQLAYAEKTNARVDAAYAEAVEGIRRDVEAGTVLRGEVLARWQEIVGTGELLRAVQARVGRWRDRVTGAFTGKPVSGEPLREALTSGVAAMIIAGAAEAEDELRGLLSSEQAPAPVTAAHAERVVRDWQGTVLELVRKEGASKRGMARVAAYTVNATGLLVMIAVFTATAFIPTGAEIGVAAGTTVVGQKLLEAIFGDQAVRQLAGKAREDLLRRIRELYEARKKPYVVESPVVGAEVLRKAGGAVEEARLAWGTGK